MFLKIIYIFIILFLLLLLCDFLWPHQVLKLSEVCPESHQAVVPHWPQAALGEMKCIVRCKIHITIAQNVHSIAVFDRQLRVAVCVCGGVCLGVTHMRISVSWLVVYMPGLACRRFLCLSHVRSHRQCVRYVRTHVCPSGNNCPSNLSVLPSLYCLSVCLCQSWLNRSRRMHQFLKSTTRINVPLFNSGLQMQIADISRYGKIHVRYACVLVYVCICACACVCIWVTSPERANVAARMHCLVIDRKLLVFQFVGNNYAIDIVLLDLHELDKFLGQFHLNISSKIYDNSNLLHLLLFNQNFLQCKT